MRDRDFAPRRLRRKAAGKPESVYVAALLRLGLPEGTKRRVTERLSGRPDVRDTTPLWPDLEAALHTALDPDVEGLHELVPDLDLSLWPNFAHLAARPRGRRLRLDWSAEGKYPADRFRQYGARQAPGTGGPAQGRRNLRLIVPTSRRYTVVRAMSPQVRSLGPACSRCSPS